MEKERDMEKDVYQMDGAMKRKWEGQRYEVDRGTEEWQSVIERGMDREKDKER